MAISSIGNSSSAPDSRSTVKQTDGQAATGANTSHSRTDSQGEAQSQTVDAVSISSRAADLQALESSVRALPDTDAARVSELRDKIQSGNYSVDSLRLADKILAFEKNL
ncbi:flagellar biosynthesis anti-sigma factor FlgM [Pseudohongiella sp. SYSU M77423]|uniref:flagellar biosynthesis anti-sigma factor FlgM n=1 Tax=Pseudohongiella sp. SYSU M77423 TaxID=3042312 RepID=UPI00248187A9|nr:flagellar biosynthesis anti-sigma factor FlgM [Pseudohongiella sp. SYSU M77423]MDH7944870.1 flagellar biosynthesis anti-sigma factor FlgM [Pseudohongiella sp. SYSU M77423]